MTFGDGLTRFEESSEMEETGEWDGRDLCGCGAFSGRQYEETLSAISRMAAVEMTGGSILLLLIIFLSIRCREAMSVRMDDAVVRATIEWGFGEEEITQWYRQHRGIDDTNGCVERCIRKAAAQ